MSGALRPRISPSPDAVPFWEACREGRLVLPRCDSCSSLFWYPRTLCQACGSRALSWEAVSGRGRLHAFTVQHSTPVAELREAVPFVTAIVELDEGPRMMSFLVEAGSDPTALRCEVPVEVVFLPSATEGQPFPAFRPAT